ncbi:MAG: pyridoxal phosphate-dependent aminotransferase [Candidatus Bathyarchaeia archaeon]
MKELAERVKSIDRPLYRAIRDYAAQLGYSDLIYLNVGEPDFPTAPHIVKVAEEAAREGFTHYTEERGILELREAIAEDLRARKGLEVNPEEGVLVTSGGAEADAAALLTLVNPGEEVIVPDPCYTPYISAIKIAGGRPVFVPVDKETLDWDFQAIESRVGENTKAIIVNSPSNPTGGVYSREVLKGIADLAADKGIYILSDEVYDAFTYEGAEAMSVAQFDQCLERTLIVNSFSKTYAMTGWRVGYLAADPKVISQVLKIRGAINVCASSISQKAALAALRGPRKTVEEMLREYRDRRRLVLEALEDMPNVTCPTPKGAFYVFPDVSALTNDSLQFTKYLIQEAHIVVSPGVAFGKAGEGHTRISYACARDKLETAMERMKRAVEKYAAKQLKN